MNAIMLEGWTPILVCGIVVGIVMFILGRKVSGKLVISTSIVLTLICIVAFIYSIVGVGGWEGMGLGFYTFSALGGIWIGTVAGTLLGKH